MTRTELNQLKDAVKKGVNMNGVDIADRPQSTKVGYILSPVVFDATHIGWEYVKDPDYVADAVAGGTYLEPMEYHVGDEVVKYTNADPFNGDGWYKFEGDTKICIKSGTPTGFDDAEYFAYEVA